MINSDKLHETVKRCIYGAFDNGFWDSNRNQNMRLEELENLRKDYLEDRIKEIVMTAEKMGIEHTYTEIRRLNGEL